MPQRTLHRYALEVLGVGRSARGVTVRVTDGEPDAELQVDFGKMGMIVDPNTGRRRVVWALVLTACYSRHTFVWLTHRQTTAELIAGCEAARAFFCGVFAVVVPDTSVALLTRTAAATGSCPSMAGSSRSPLRSEDQRAANASSADGWDDCLR